MAISAGDGFRDGFRPRPEHNLRINIHNQVSITVITVINNSYSGQENVKSSTELMWKSYKVKSFVQEINNFL